MGKWLIENIPWIFSGVGVFALGLIISMNKKIIPKIKKGVLFVFEKLKFKNKSTNCNDTYYDDSIFISERPYDGVTIPVGKIFEKSWTIMNNGNMIWENRTLRCVEYVDSYFYPINRIIDIPKTLPKQTVTLKVRYKVLAQGDYHSKWKMYDKNNNLVYPDKNIGLGVNISAR